MEQGPDLTDERFSGLLAAVMAVGSDLELAAVLRRIVETAVQLVDCEYGALGVIGERVRGVGRGPVGKNSCGVCDDRSQRRRPCADRPVAPRRGILGLLVRHPEPLRLADLGTRGFRWVPSRTSVDEIVPQRSVRIREEVFGNLYLTEKHGGLNSPPPMNVSSSPSQRHAGIAIENARLFGEPVGQKNGGGPWPRLTVNCWPVLTLTVSCN